MKHLLTGIVLCCLTVAAQAQNTFKAVIRGSEEQTPLAGATITWQQQKASYIADTTGTVTIPNIPDGTQSFVITHVGFEETTVTYTFPLPSDTLIVIAMEEGEEEHEEEEVIVTATRLSRTIANIPTRVEVLSGEELGEKGNMRPGNLQMLLNETTGIQTQVTSPASANASIRIQGLDGRYTQILRDGLPLYGGFSGGLSIMQIAPLDLRQVEVIKGSASTLFGAGAIAGIVNLVSKEPSNERELSFLANATTAGGLDLSGFYSQKYGKVGLTVFGSRNTGSAYDPADIGLTAIPKFERYTINPRLFIYGENTTANVGFSYITEDRLGGSMDYIKRGTSGYFEQNNTDRITAQLGVTHRLSDRAALNFKNSYTRFDRQLFIPSYQFQGLQQSSFSELTYGTQGEKSEWIIGANFLTDDFKEEQHQTNPLRDYQYNTYGVFVQNQWSPSNFLTLETGLRGDYVNDYGFELLPRVSAMLRLSPKVTTRIGGGFGYKTPTIFNEESERVQFQNILPINTLAIQNERSVGTNVDVNYRTAFGDLGFTINQLFFYTRLNQPLVLTNSGTASEFVNATGYIDTKGGETNLRLTYGDFKLFVGYTYADVNSHFEGRKGWFPLTARHRLNNVLMYEKDEKLKIGLEAYYFSPQRLNDGATGKSYWIMGLMGEKVWERFPVFLNLENFTNTRQTRFDTIYTGSVNNPSFRDVYAPLEGFVVNGGIKIRL